MVRKKTVSLAICLSLLWSCLCPTEMPRAQGHGVNSQELDFYASDGIEPGELIGLNVYLGQYRHATALRDGHWGPVTQREEEPSPILWKVMGQEDTAIGQDTEAESVLTLLSRYVLDAGLSIMSCWKWKATPTFIAWITITSGGRLI